MSLAPWKVLQSTHVYPRIRIDKCDLPNGHQLDATILEYRSWANILAVTKDQQAVLVRQYRHGAKKVLLELPGGVVEDGEDPMDGIRRELMEETGYTSANMIEVGRVYPNPAMQTNQLFCYLALDAEKIGVQNLDAGEDIEVQLIPLTELTHMARKGEFSHALHVAVLFHALAYLEQK
ncbi:MAG: NUDIX hydrolase [Chloroflexi bacterium]|nr:NUDIX hydrolase [Chloroflexota bacterium]